MASFKHPLQGADGEELALDAARVGPAQAKKLLIVSSGCHGVEGYCGSGVQVHALRDAAFRENCEATGVAVLHLHAINPFGFSHTRRVTHENVDLNRNFQDFSKPLPQNPAYRELHTMLLPKEWPPTALNMASLAWYIATKGMKAAQQALSGGQYEVDDGLFFGGKGPTWSNRTLRQVLREYGAGVPQVAWIDLHSGLGEEGESERTFAMRRDDTAGQARARAWWEGGGATPLKSLDDGLFFGGKGPTWSNRTLRQVLREYGAGVPQVAWIDLHSGLGEEGESERTFAMRRDDTAGQARARAWWEGGGATPLKSLDDGSSVSAALTGLMWPVIYDECPHAQVTSIAMEFGTQDKLKVLKALRGDHWHYQHPDAPEALVKDIKKTLRDAFYVDTLSWKEKIVTQAMQAINQGVEGLGNK